MLVAGRGCSRGCLPWIWNVAPAVSVARCAATPQRSGPCAPSSFRLGRLSAWPRGGGRAAEGGPPERATPPRPCPASLSPRRTERSSPCLRGLSSARWPRRSRRVPALCTPSRALLLSVVSGPRPRPCRRLTLPSTRSGEPPPARPGPHPQGCSRGCAPKGAGTKSAFVFPIRPACTTSLTEW